MSSTILPVVKEIEYQQPLTIFNHFSQVAWSIFLDSAYYDKQLGRYSFIAMDPFQHIIAKNGQINIKQPVAGTDPLEIIRNELKKYVLPKQEHLPPFQGGMAGYFAYDICHLLENIPVYAVDDLQFPDIAVGFYDLVIAFDNVVKQAWIISSGFPAMTTTLRIQRAQQRCEWLLHELAQPASAFIATEVVCAETDIHSNFTEANYLRAVQKVIDYIYAGDIFEANISQRFAAQLPAGLTPFQLYGRLRKINSAPFAAYLNFGDVFILSASPERFLRMHAKLVESRPVKGTRPRGATQQQDTQLANELINSEKDWAENVMIVDLMRNDLAKVCLDHSVTVKQLCQLESYATVHHLVSVIEGRLQNNYDAIDLLKATFPGGSITGAPKVRAMAIIAELEPHQRGPYCGSIGYINFNGDMDSAITIRTYAIKNDQVTFHTGGAVVADSDPAQEYAETLTKAAALHRALTSVE